VPDLETALGLLAIVLIVSALASGLVVRAPLSFPMIFLFLGVLIGEHGLGLISIHPEDATLEAVAIVSLSLVLFIDAVQMRLDELRTGWLLPVLTTGPGTLLTIGLVGLAAFVIFGLPAASALIVGAALSSLDPVVVRDVVRDTRIPNAIRQTLRLEGGTNDLVVLPAILILIAVSRAEVGGVAGWLGFFGQLLVLGPVAGLVVGGVGSWAIGQVDRRYPVPTEYQALFGIGLVFAAFVAGEQVGGSGFLAAFVAGFAVVVFNNELCECFVEYGEVTAEMAMLLAFILLGAALSTIVGSIPLGLALLFAFVVLGVARPVAIAAVLHRATVSRGARLFIAFFGPRGLNSLLLMLLVVHAGVPGAERMLGIVGIVVMVSVVVHGMSATPLGAWYERRRAGTVLPEERESTAAGLFLGPAAEVPRISPAELAQLLAGAHPPLVLDVRTGSQYRQDGTRIPGSIRVPPDDVTAWAQDQDRSRSVVTYCT
jgi:sodium/hydrogen antiporter